MYLNFKLNLNYSNKYNPNNNAKPKSIPNSTP